jgi:hypothetical protein
MSTAHDETPEDVQEVPEVVAHEAADEEIPCIVDGSTHCGTMKPE